MECKNCNRDIDKEFYCKWCYYDILCQNITKINQLSSYKNNEYFQILSNDIDKLREDIIEIKIILKKILDKPKSLS
jgi:hypothetical protein